MPRETVRVRRKEKRDLAVRAPNYYWDEYFSFDPGVPGTELIMRVYEALQARRIPFYFSYFMGDALMTVGLKEALRVHFFLPEHNTAIIVAGGYWYDKGDNINDTAMDIALLEYAGVHPVFWTEPEIEYWGLDELFSRDHIFSLPHSAGGAMETDYEPYNYKGFAFRPGHPLRKERAVTVRGRRYGD